MNLIQGGRVKHIAGHTVLLMIFAAAIGCQSNNQLDVSKNKEVCSATTVFVELSREHRIDKHIGIELVSINDNVATIKTLWDEKEYSAKEGGYFRYCMYLEKIDSDAGSIRIILEHPGIMVRPEKNQGSRLNSTEVGKD